MKPLQHDAKDFIDGVTRYLRDQNSQPSLLPKVTALFHKVSAQSHKNQLAQVESSVALTAQEKQRVNDFVSTLVNHPVTWSWQVNPHLIGGIKISVDDWVLDTSLLWELEEMSASLIAI